MSNLPPNGHYFKHNRVYGGRAIRVQLRECNVSRGTWKPPRDRRPASTYAYTIKRSESAGAGKAFNTDVLRRNQEEIVSPSEDVVPGRPTETEGREDGLDFHSANHGTQPLVEIIHSNNNSETFNSVGTTTEEENENDSAAQESLLTNAPQTNSMPLSMNPFAYHSFGYYPAPWFHPYLQQVQYQFPYYAGYAGYVVPPPMFRPSPPSNVDGNTSGSIQAPWHPSVGSYGVRDFISMISVELTRLTALYPLPSCHTTPCYGYEHNPIYSGTPSFD